MAYFSDSDDFADDLIVLDSIGTFSDGYESDFDQQPDSISNRPCAKNRNKNLTASQSSSKLSLKNSPSKNGNKFVGGNKERKRAKSPIFNNTNDAFGTKENQNLAGSSTQSKPSFQKSVIPKNSKSKNPTKKIGRLVVSTAFCSSSQIQRDKHDRKMCSTPKRRRKTSKRKNDLSSPESSDLEDPEIIIKQLNSQSLNQTSTVSFSEDEDVSIIPSTQESSEDSQQNQQRRSIFMSKGIFDGIRKENCFMKGSSLRINAEKVKNQCIASNTIDRNNVKDCEENLSCIDSDPAIMDSGEKVQKNEKKPLLSLKNSPVPPIVFPESSSDEDEDIGSKKKDSYSPNSSSSANSPELFSTNEKVKDNNAYFFGGEKNSHSDIDDTQPYVYIDWDTQSPEYLKDSDDTVEIDDNNDDKPLITKPCSEKSPCSPQNSSESTIEYNEVKEAEMKPAKPCMLKKSMDSTIEYHQWVGGENRMLPHSGAIPLNLSGATSRMSLPKIDSGPGDDPDSESSQSLLKKEENPVIPKQELFSQTSIPELSQQYNLSAQRSNYEMKYKEISMPRLTPQKNSFVATSQTESSVLKSHLSPQTSLTLKSGPSSSSMPELSQYISTETQSNHILNKETSVPKLTIENTVRLSGPYLSLNSPGFTSSQVPRSSGGAESQNNVSDSPMFSQFPASPFNLDPKSKANIDDILMLGITNNEENIMEKQKCGASSEPSTSSRGLSVVTDQQPNGSSLMLHEPSERCLIKSENTFHMGEELVFSKKTDKSTVSTVDIKGDEKLVKGKHVESLTRADTLMVNTSGDKEDEMHDNGTVKDEGIDGHTSYYSIESDLVSVFGSDDEELFLTQSVIDRSSFVEDIRVKDEELSDDGLAIKEEKSPWWDNNDDDFLLKEITERVEEGSKLSEKCIVERSVMGREISKNGVESSNEPDDDKKSESSDGSITDDSQDSDYICVKMSIHRRPTTDDFKKILFPEECDSVEEKLVSDDVHEVCTDDTDMKVDKSDEVEAYVAATQVDEVEITDDEKQSTEQGLGEADYVNRKGGLSSVTDVFSLSTQVVEVNEESDDDVYFAQTQIDYLIVSSDDESNDEAVIEIKEEPLSSPKSDLYAVDSDTEVVDEPEDVDILESDAYFAATQVYPLKSNESFQQSPDIDKDEVYEMATQVQSCHVEEEESGFSIDTQVDEVSEDGDQDSEEDVEAVYLMDTQPDEFPEEPEDLGKSDVDKEHFEKSSPEKYEDHYEMNTQLDEVESEGEPEETDFTRVKAQTTPREDFISSGGDDSPEAAVGDTSKQVHLVDVTDDIQQEDPYQVDTLEDDFEMQEEEEMLKDNDYFYMGEELSDENELLDEEDKKEEGCKDKAFEISTQVTVPKLASRISEDTDVTENNIVEYMMSTQVDVSDSVPPDKALIPQKISKKFPTMERGLFDVFLLSDDQAKQTANDQSVSSTGDSFPDFSENQSSSAKPDYPQAKATPAIDSVKVQKNIFSRFLEDSPTSCDSNERSSRGIKVDSLKKQSKQTICSISVVEKDSSNIDKGKTLHPKQFTKSSELKDESSHSKKRILSKIEETAGDIQRLKQRKKDTEAKLDHKMLPPSKASIPFSSKKSKFSTKEKPWIKKPMANKNQKKFKSGDNLSPNIDRAKRMLKERHRMQNNVPTSSSCKKAKTRTSDLSDVEMPSTQEILDQQLPILNSMSTILKKAENSKVTSSERQNKSKNVTPDPNDLTDANQNSSASTSSTSYLSQFSLSLSSSSSSSSAGVKGFLTSKDTLPLVALKNTSLKGSVASSDHNIMASSIPLTCSSVPLTCSFVPSSSAPSLPPPATPNSASSESAHFGSSIKTSNLTSCDTQLATKSLTSVSSEDFQSTSNGTKTFAPIPSSNLSGSAQGKPINHLLNATNHFTPKSAHPIHSSTGHPVHDTAQHPPVHGSAHHLTSSDPHIKTQTQKGILKMTTIRPMGQRAKRSVQFDTSKDTVLFIERVQSRPLLQPFDMTKKMRKEPVKPFCKENEFVWQILKWAPKWILEQEESCKGKRPPILGEKQLVCRLREYYDDLLMYQTITYNLFLLEVWAMLSQGWQSSHKYLPVVIKSKPMYLNDEDKTLDLLTISVEGVTTEPYHCPLSSDILVLDMKGRLKKNTQDDPISLQQFALVKSLHKSFVQDNGNSILHAPGIKEHFPDLKNPKACVFTLQVKIKYKEFIPCDLMRIKKISSLTSSLRQFHALVELPHSTLCEAIVNPDPDSQVFSLDEPEDPEENLLKYLNKEQALAVTRIREAVCCYPYDSRVCMLQGPPGTGKSHTIMVLIHQILMKTRFQAKICLAAPSNAAVDEIARKIVDLSEKKCKAQNSPMISLVRMGTFESVSEEMKPYHIHSLIKRHLQEQHEKTIPKSLYDARKAIESKISSLTAQLQRTDISDAQKVSKRTELKRLQQKDLKKIEEEMTCTNKDRGEAKNAIVKSCHVICGTLSSFGSPDFMPFLRANNSDRRREPFTCLIVDEATQAVEMDCLIPLQHHINKLVLVGDQAQLPATVLSQEARDCRLDRSLFERLHTRFESCDKSGTAVVMLKEQHRMHPDIVKLPNAYFYNDELTTAESCAKSRTSNLSPYLVFDVMDSRESSGNRGNICSKSNINEAQCVVSLCEQVVALLSHSKKTNNRQRQRKIGVICPYSDQRTLIKKRLDRVDMGSIAVNTVDGFQGQEKDVIIMSCVRAQGNSHSVGFIDDSKRMNVALTRARLAMYIIGHQETLRTSELWKHLYKDARERKLLVTVQKTAQFSEIAYKRVPLRNDHLKKKHENKNRCELK